MSERAKDISKQNYIYYTMKYAKERYYVYDKIRTFLIKVSPTVEENIHGMIKQWTINFDQKETMQFK